MLRPYFSRDTRERGGFFSFLKTEISDELTIFRALNMQNLYMWY